jgi:hypothetical protein
MGDARDQFVEDAFVTGAGIEHRNFRDWNHSDFS